MGLAATAVKAVDLGTNNGCAATDAQFKNTVLYTGPLPPGAQDPKSNSVLKTTFVKQADGSVDVYFIQKQGVVKRYNGKSGTVDDLGTITVDTRQNEYGLVGIAAPKDFLTKPYLYFQYAASSGTTLSTRISRFKLNADLSKLDLTSELVLINIARESVTWHTAGAMQFDDYGDLWMTIGDNQQTDKGPGNTADFRGGILRIHPDDAAPNGYTIPKGNFAEVFKAKATGDMAAKWADTNVVKPQIYVKGTRNAYTMFVDPVRRWVGWGDVGPDQGKVSEEYNLVKEPVFAGWPYYAGEEDMTGISAYGNAGAIKAGSTKAAPVNGAGLGIKNLPPVTDPIFARNQGCAMVGPIFRYDGTNTYAGQFPPQMNRKWLIGGCDGYGWHLITLNDAGTSFTKNETIWSQMTPKVTTLVDAKQGPDGAVYYVDYGKGTVNKIEYTGTCKDPSMLPEVAPANPNLTRKTPSRAQWLAFDRRSISVSAQGGHQIEILDLHGRVLAALSGTGPQSHAMPLLPAAGLYHLRVRAASGEVFAALPYIGK
jgi:glucose/arabinose dehydrogenase